MACKCDSCEHNRNIDVYREKQPEGNCKKLTKVVKKNPVSKKILMDRYHAARKNLLLQIKWYQESYERRKKNPPKPNARYVDWFHEPIKHNSWGVRKYKEARAEAKNRGLL